MDLLATTIPKLSAFLTSILVFFSSMFGSYSAKVDCMNTVTEITDGFYVMDYTCDYNSKKLMEKGINNAIEIIVNGLEEIFNPFNIGCTTFNSVTKNGNYLLSRNFEYPDSPGLLVRTTPKDGYASISTISLYMFAYSLDSDFKPDDTSSNILTLLAPYTCLDGINEKGLSIGILELETTPTYQMSFKPNLTTSTIARVCLDYAATVEEAIDIFASYDMHDILLDECSYHYQISDANGKSAIIEYVDNEMHVIYPEENSKNAVNFQAATNFHLVEGAEDPIGYGQDRYEYVMSTLSKTKGITSEKEAMAILKHCSAKDQNMGGYVCSTMWSNVFNMSKKTVSVCCFGNYNKTYTFSVNKPLLDQIKK